MDAFHICPSHIFSDVVDQISQALNDKRSFKSFKRSKEYWQGQHL
jgi:hypothetical protein